MKTVALVAALYCFCLTQFPFAHPAVITTKSVPEDIKANAVVIAVNVVDKPTIYSAIDLQAAVLGQQGTHQQGQDQQGVDNEFSRPAADKPQEDIDAKAVVIVVNVVDKPTIYSAVDVQAQQGQQEQHHQKHDGQQGQDGQQDQPNQEQGQDAQQGQEQQSQEQQDQDNQVMVIEPREDIAQQHSRQKRATCDLLSAANVGHSACAAHCLLLGKRGGYCNSRAICVCRN